MNLQSIVKFIFTDHNRLRQLFVLVRLADLNQIQNRITALPQKFNHAVVVGVNIVVNGMEFSDAVDNAVVSSDREILRKLLEFGYCDERGTKIKDYTTNSDKILYANK